MAQDDAISVRLPLEAIPLIHEIHISASAAVLAVETAYNLLGNPSELMTVFGHLRALADAALELSELIERPLI